MSDPQLLAIVASNLLGKTFVEIEQDKTVTYTLDTIAKAILHAQLLIGRTNPFGNNVLPFVNNVLR